MKELIILLGCAIVSIVPTCILGNAKEDGVVRSKKQNIRDFFCYIIALVADGMGVYFALKGTTRYEMIAYFLFFGITGLHICSVIQRIRRKDWMSWVIFAFAFSIILILFIGLAIWVEHPRIF